jgi:ubiquitin carboxyl-terminal hydrolase 14
MSAAIEVTVLWGSKRYTVPVDPSRPVSDFMNQLFNLTQVPVASQKLMIPHKQFRPNSTWDPGDLKPGVRFLLVGNADPDFKIPVGPESDSDSPAPEPIPEGDRDQFIGLENYGNTCFLNAILQVLRSLPDFVKIVSSVVLPPPGDDPESRLACALVRFIRKFPSDLLVLITALRAYAPEFKTRDDNGQYMQQDAAECWGILMSCVRRAVAPAAADLFDIRFRQTVTTPGSDDPPVVSETTETFLKCHIGAETRFLHEGVSLVSDVEEKHIQLEIAALPRYLTVQMMRFFFRKDEDTAAKITRAVEYPSRLDILPWVSPELKKELVGKKEKEHIPRRYYGLKAIVTHRGRSCHSGHYVAHVKVGENWYRYDDKKVTQVEDEDIAFLAGDRADWHCSYILIYERL